MRIYAADEGQWIDADIDDITEAVQALYDLAMGSMDYGSGFWTYEDAAPVLKLAKLMGWEGADGLQQYHDDDLHRTEASAWMADNGHSLHWCKSCTYAPESFDVVKEDGSVVHIRQLKLAPHEHAFSTPGRCMVHDCPEVEQRG